MNPAIAKPQNLTKKRSYSDLLLNTWNILGMVLLLGVIIFFGDLAVLTVLSTHSEKHLIKHSLIDAALLMALISPALYELYYKTIRKRVDALHKSEEDIRALSQKLMQVAEDEQRKLALDLHDELGQTLSAIRMEVESARQQLDSAPPEFTAACTTIQRHLDTMRESIHLIAARLRPSTLDDFGIQTALEGMIHDLQEQYPHITFNLAVRGLKRRPPAQVETVIFRICQEALTNIVKHAKAAKVDIHLISSYPDLILTIRDNGQGFDMHNKLNRAQRGRHLGIVGMRERTISLGGHFMLSSHPEHGTTIRAVFPRLQEEA